MKRLCKIAVFMLVIGLILAVVGGIWGGHLYLPWDRGNTAEWDSQSGRNSVTEVSDFSTDTLDKVTALDLDLDAVEFVIEEGTDWNLESDFSDTYLTTNLDGTTLYIKANRSRPWRKHTQHHTVVLTVPEDVHLATFDCDLDAGTVEIDTLRAKQTILNVDAGSIEIDTLRGGSLDADCDAGSIEILSARLTRGSALDCDAGSIELGLHKDSTLSTVSGSVQLGSITINGQDCGDGLSEQFSTPLIADGNASGETLTLDCDVGSIEITSD